MCRRRIGLAQYDGLRVPTGKADCEAAFRTQNTKMLARFTMPFCRAEAETAGASEDEEGNEEVQGTLWRGQRERASWVVSVMEVSQAKP